MLIKYQALAPLLRRKWHALYVLVGQEHYLLNESARDIKKAWEARGESDNKTLDLIAVADWSLLLEEANSYSLFAELVLIDARFDKKSLDSTGKALLQNYLKDTNPRCLIMIRAPLIPPKQLQWLANHEHVLIVQAQPLTASALQQFIATELRTRGIRFEPEIPALIHHYTQGNMLASSQLIEKLALIHDMGNTLTRSTVLNQLTDQCEYQLYELADACLSAQPEKAIHLLQQAQHNKTEPTLILWLLTQEIRQLIQLAYLRAQSLSLASACSQLNIWPQRATLYEKTLTRVPLPRLQELLILSQQTDERIKSNQNKQVWHALDQIAITLSSRRLTK